MTNRDRRRQGRETSRATIRSVAAAPCFKASKKKRTRRSPIRRVLILSLMLAALGVATASMPKLAHAGNPLPTTPEIDPGSMAGAMTLLVGGVLALTDRHRRV
jgi:hypothetical protein